MAETKASWSPATEFARGLSAELTVREMQQAMKAAGHEITDARVYQIRRKYKLGYKSAANLGRPRPKQKPQPKKKKVARVTARAALAAIPVKPTVTDNARVQVRKLALQIGLPRIEELVRELKREAGIE